MPAEVPVPSMPILSTNPWHTYGADKCHIDNVVQDSEAGVVTMYDGNAHVRVFE